jgi:cell fate regulator YaaT (PSP1 superfamily)
MGIEMNNEPVAWMYERPNGASKLSFVKEKMLWEDMLEIPLYTHPVKELTDEEIHDLIINKTTDADMIKQAIRKAQEK